MSVPETTTTDGARAALARTAATLVTVLVLLASAVAYHNGFEHWW